MKSLMLATKKFVRGEDGVTAIEYALIAALIAIVVIATLGTVGDNLGTVFEAVADALTTG